MPTEFTRIEEIFAEAVTKTDAAARAACLDLACGGDAELRQRVEQLLAAHDATNNFLKLPDASGTVVQEPPIAEGAGTVIGPYKLLQQIGEGGMGVVFMAEQTEPIQRTVALKIIKPGMDTRQVIARFEAERQALAMMDHPNIARAIDAGATDTCRSYFVMDLVKGVLITKYCDDKQLSIRQRLELFKPVCEAIQHAHQKGIIHRDLKPTNVLVAEYDNRPVPKVIDFGVAKATAQKLTERTMFTEFGQVIGTVEYMSPEQAKLNQLDIDTRSDIYSLGVLLYELLTGSTPFERHRLQKSAFDEMLRIIREEEPPKPSTRLSSLSQADERRGDDILVLASIAANRHTDPAKLNKIVRGELDWIVMKCLEKDRNRRYDTASALSNDLARHLNDQPVEASPPSAAYRLRKFAIRNKPGLISAGLIAIALMIGSAVSAWQAIRATHALARETELRKEAELKGQVIEAENLCAAGEFERAEKLISTVPARIIATQSQAATLVYRDLANWNGAQKRWQKAADDYYMFMLGPAQHGMGRDNSYLGERPWYSMDYLSYAPVLVELGDSAGYEKLRAAAVAKFGGSVELVVCERVLMACVLLPFEDKYLKTFENWAHVDVTLMRSCWAMAAAGLFEHRRSEHLKAVEYCQTCLAPGVPVVCRARARLIMAMAYARLNQQRDAESAMEEYRDEIESRFKGKLGMGTYEAGFWKDWLIDRVLLREADQLLASRPKRTALETSIEP